MSDLKTAINECSTIKEKLKVIEPIINEYEESKRKLCEMLSVLYKDIADQVNEYNSVAAELSLDSRLALAHADQKADSEYYMNAYYISTPESGWFPSMNRC